MGLTESTVSRWSGGPSKSRSISQFPDHGYEAKPRQAATLPNRPFAAKPSSPQDSEFPLRRDEASSHGHWPSHDCSYVPPYSARDGRIYSREYDQRHHHHDSGGVSQQPQRPSSSREGRTRSVVSHHRDRRSRSSTRPRHRTPPPPLESSSPNNSSARKNSDDATNYWAEIPAVSASPTKSRPARGREESKKVSKNSSHTKSRTRSSHKEKQCKDTQESIVVRECSPGRKTHKHNRKSEPLCSSRPRSGSDPELCVPSRFVASETDIHQSHKNTSDNSPRVSSSRPRPSAIYVSDDHLVQEIVHDAFKASSAKRNKTKTRRASATNDAISLNNNSKHHISTLNVSAHNLQTRHRQSRCESSQMQDIYEVANTSPVLPTFSQRYSDRTAQSYCCEDLCDEISSNALVRTPSNVSSGDCKSCHLTDTTKNPVRQESKLPSSFQLVGNSTNSLPSSANHRKKSELFITLENMEHCNDDLDKVNDKRMFDTQGNSWYDLSAATSHHQQAPDSCQSYSYNPVNAVNTAWAHNVTSEPVQNGLSYHIGNSILAESAMCSCREASYNETVPPQYLMETPVDSKSNTFYPYYINTNLSYDEHIDARICNGQIQYFDSSEVDYSSIPFVFKDCDDASSQLNYFHMYHDVNSAIYANHLEERSRAEYYQMMSANASPSQLLPSSASGLHSSNRPPASCSACANSCICYTKHLQVNTDTIVPAVCSYVDDLSDTSLMQQGAGRHLTAPCQVPDSAKNVPHSNSCSRDVEHPLCDALPYQCLNNQWPLLFSSSYPVETLHRQSIESISTFTDVTSFNELHVNVDLLHDKHISSNFNHRSLDLEGFTTTLSELRLPLLDNQPRLVEILKTSTPSLDEIEAMAETFLMNEESKQRDREQQQQQQICVPESSRRDDANDVSHTHVAQEMCIALPANSDISGISPTTLSDIPVGGVNTNDTNKDVQLNAEDCITIGSDSAVDVKFDNVMKVFEDSGLPPDDDTSINSIKIVHAKESERSSDNCITSTCTNVKVPSTCEESCSILTAGSSIAASETTLTSPCGSNSHQIVDQVDATPNDASEVNATSSDTGHVNDTSSGTDQASSSDPSLECPHSYCGDHTSRGDITATTSKTSHRHSWNPWSAFTSSAATLKERFHTAGHRRQANKRTLARSLRSRSLVLDDISVPPDVAEDISVPADVAEDISVPADVAEDISVPADVAEDIGVPAGVAQDICVPANVAEDISVPADVAQDICVSADVAQDITQATLPSVSEMCTNTGEIPNFQLPMCTSIKNG